MKKETKRIAGKEKKNDGSVINLYYNQALGMWQAFGVSAYALRLFGKTYNQDNPRGYSETHQLPCTIADKHSLDKLIDVSKMSGVDPAQEQELSFFIPAKVDRAAYERWVDKLRQREAKSISTASDSADVEDAAPLPGMKKTVKKGYVQDGMSSFERNVKRLIDCAMALGAMVVFSPLFLVCWAAIKFEDHGPAIFKQERIGRFGKPFYIYKFRSMRPDAEKMGPQLSHSSGEGDARLTRVGRFLRAHHLDELPQLWNVFLGDMAFIGPRPERKFYIDQILEYDTRYTYLYQIRPGVTSYATLYNGYTDTMAKMLRRLEYDLYYLEHRSWGLDFRILTNTFLSIVFGKKF